MSADPRPQPATITLGAKTWTIRPLTLRQVEALEPPVARGSGESPFAYGLAVVSAALARDHEPDIAGLRDLEATSADLAEATRTVLILAGCLPGADRMVPRHRRRADALGRAAALPRLEGPSAGPRTGGGVPGREGASRSATAGHCGRIGDRRPEWHRRDDPALPGWAGEGASGPKVDQLGYRRPRFRPIAEAGNVRLRGGR
jgi:hypothetical protein